MRNFVSNVVGYVGCAIIGVETFAVLALVNVTTGIAQAAETTIDLFRK